MLLLECFLPVSEEGGIQGWQELEASASSGRPQSSLPSGTPAWADSGYPVLSLRESAALSGQIRLDKTFWSSFYVPGLVWGRSGSRGTKQSQIHEELNLKMAGQIRLTLAGGAPHHLTPLVFQQPDRVTG